MYIISGIFLQIDYSLGVGYSERTNSNAVFITPGATPLEFSGYVRKEAGILRGEMIDPLGTSTLHDIVIEEERLGYKKVYHNVAWSKNPPMVSYDLSRRPDGFFVGEYVVGSENGAAFCSLQEVPDSLVQELIALQHKIMG